MKSEKYGTYYGTLVNCVDNEELCFNYYDTDRTQKLVKELMETGVKEVLLDVENDDNYSATMYFETDENTDYKSLMVLIANVRPDEFSEETDYHFRMWFD